MSVRVLLYNLALVQSKKPRYGRGPPDLNNGAVLMKMFQGVHTGAGYMLDTAFVPSDSCIEGGIER